MDALVETIQIDIMNLRNSIFFIAIQPFTRLIYLKKIPNHNAASIIDALKAAVDQYKAKRIICDQEFDKDQYRQAVPDTKILCVRQAYEQHTKLAHVNRACRTVRDVFNAYFFRSQLPDDALADALMTYVNTRLKNRYFNKPNSLVSFDENLALHEARERRYQVMRFQPGETVFVKYIKTDELSKSHSSLWCKRPHKIIGIEDRMYALVDSSDLMGPVIFRDDTQVRRELPKRYEAVTYDAPLEQSKWRYATRIIGQQGRGNYWVERPDGSRTIISKFDLQHIKGRSALEEEFIAKIESDRPKIYSV